MTISRVWRKSFWFLMIPLLMGHEECGGPINPAGDAFLVHHDGAAVKRLERVHCEILTVLYSLGETILNRRACAGVTQSQSGKGVVFSSGSQIHSGVQVADDIRGFKELESVEIHDFQSIMNSSSKKKS